MPQKTSRFGRLHWRQLHFCKRSFVWWRWRSVFIDLRHNYYCNMASDDQHYTPEEHFRVVNGCGAICDWLVGVVQESLGTHDGVLQSIAVSLVDQYTAFNVLCQCKAHQELSQNLAKMISTTQPLNNHWGVELAESLFPLILNKPGLDMTVNPCHAGTPYNVNFISTACLPRMCFNSLVFQILLLMKSQLSMY